MHYFTLAALAALATLFAPLPRGGSQDQHQVYCDGTKIDATGSAALIVPAADPTKTLLSVELAYAFENATAWGHENTSAGKVLFQATDRHDVSLSEVRATGGDFHVGALWVLHRDFPYTELEAFDGTLDYAGGSGDSGVQSDQHSITLNEVNCLTAESPASYWQDDTSDDITPGVPVLNITTPDEGVALIWKLGNEPLYLQTDGEGSWWASQDVSVLDVVEVKPLWARITYTYLES